MFALLLTVFSVRLSSNKSQIDALLLDNIEALAAYEYEDGTPYNCFGRGSVDCPKTKVKVEYVGIGYNLEK